MLGANDRKVTNLLSEDGEKKAFNQSIVVFIRRIILAS
jgi:hypothetical protein